MSHFKLKLLVHGKAWQADGCSLKCASSHGGPWKHEDDLGNGQCWVRICKDVGKCGKYGNNSNHIDILNEKRWKYIKKGRHKIKGAIQNVKVMHIIWHIIPFSHNCGPAVKLMASSPSGATGTGRSIILAAFPQVSPTARVSKL